MEAGNERGDFRGKVADDRREGESGIGNGDQGRGSFGKLVSCRDDHGTG